MSDEDFKARVPELAQHCVSFRYVTGSYDDDDTFVRLKQILDAGDISNATDGNRLYYLATVPSAFATVAEGLGKAGMAEETPGTFRRLVIEKPFGRDLASAEQLDDCLHEVFHEHQIFRIDHYLAKETVQNILALRFANAIFEPVWNRRYVNHVELTVAEDLGVGHRSTFYEQAGALRDIVQNHLLQVLALTAMEPPASFEADAVRDEKVKLLRSVRMLQPWDLPQLVVRGQYGPGEIHGEPVPGYRQEEGVASDSTTETFLALRLEIDNWRWAGVPFFVRTGKHLPHRVTEVAVHYKQVPFLPLPKSAVDSIEPNTTVVRIQPDEGVEVVVRSEGAGVAVPGEDRRPRLLVPGGVRRGAARGLRAGALGCAGRRRHPVHPQRRGAAVVADRDAARRGVPAQRTALVLLPAGSWGPPEADALFGPEDNDHWRTP